MASHDQEPNSARLDALLTGTKRWSIRTAIALLAAIALAAIASVAIHIQINRWWFASVDAGDVYTTMLRAQILLFVLFGGLAALVGGVSVARIQRAGRARARRWARHFDPETQKWRSRFVAHERVLGRILVVVAVALPGVMIGRRASGRWQSWELWRHADAWGVTDPTFGRDVSYYVEIYPMHRMTVNLLTSATVWAIGLTLITAYLYGGLRLRGHGSKVTRPVKVQLSILGALYLVLRAGGFWLDRFAIVTSQRAEVTGPSYTDLHAVLPGKAVLIAVSLIGAVALIANVFVARLRLIAITAVGMIAALVLVGSVWPGAVMKFREQPSAATVELSHIRHNQEATMAAFGLADQVHTIDGSSGTKLTGSALRDQAARSAQVRVLDPARLSPTFNVKQQLQAYYSFKQTLDVDRYPLGKPSHSQDVAIAARELHLPGISRGSWANRHLVYTHGYGVVAAPTDTLDQATGTPKFVAGGTPSDPIPVAQPQIYFGQSSPNYSIVGQPAGSSTQLEFDHPGGVGSKAAHTTYTGDGGIGIGSTWRRAIFAAALHSPNILLSKEINSASRILTVRDPRHRVAAVAPWLTLDGDVYPAVVEGRIEWIVDGYTSTSNYPDSELVNLHDATSSTLTHNGSTVSQPGRMVNYLRNSVKATVDAYTGAVTLYEWNQDAQPDPLLATWEKVFPGLVQPQSTMPAALVAHLRYPQDLFNVQRSLLTKYHVDDAADFYNGNDFWAVPSDPTVAATKQLNAGTYTPAGHIPSEPSTYMSLAATGSGDPTFALSSPLVTLNKHELAGFLSVDAQPGPTYGHFTLLEFPAGSAVDSPAQVQNDIESTTQISEALTLQRGGNSKVVLGNLLTIPVGGRMLYVEPVYTQASGANSFPILRHVIAIYGDGDPAFEDTLPAALAKAISNGDH